MANSKMRVMVVAGTRPEWIRLACCIHRLRETCDLVVVHTGQNYDYELNEIFFRDLQLGKPDHYLDAAGETAAETIGTVIAKSDRVIREVKPDAVLILGDTNSCLAVIAARKNRVPVYHMEAGNRCFDFNVPEELNRRIVDHAADFNLCYTEHARRHLLSEGLPHRRIYVTGSPMREVLEHFATQIEASTVLQALGLKPQGYLITSFHREENVDNPVHLRAIIAAISAVADEHGVKTIVSTHPRTRKRMEEAGIAIPANMMFLKPFGFHDYNKLQKEALCAISDSGTISEESAILGFPAVTIRNAMERPEALDSGAIVITGLNATVIADAVRLVLADRSRGMTPDMPAGYEIRNTSQRVLRLILGTAKLNNRWHGIDRAG